MPAVFEWRIYARHAVALDIGLHKFSYLSRLFHGCHLYACPCSFSERGLILLVAVVKALALLHAFGMAKAVDDAKIVAILAAKFLYHVLESVERYNSKLTALSLAFKLKTNLGGDSGVGDIVVEHCLKPPQYSIEFVFLSLGIRYHRDEQLSTLLNINLLK